MAYNKTIWHNNQAPAINEANLNKIEEQLAQDSARIDEIVTLPPGSTQGNAELVDIRVGAGGETYPNAGTAVREQIGAIKEDLENITESTRNLLSYSKSAWRSMASGYADCSIDGDKITITSNHSGTYIYCYQIIDARALDSITISYEGYEGTGQRQVRVGFCNADGSSLTWKKNVSDLPFTMDVSEASYLWIAFYATYTTNSPAGVYVTYKKLQVEEGDSATKFIRHATAIDLTARANIENQIEDVKLEIPTTYPCGIVIPTLIDGYVRKANGTFSTYSGDGAFKRTDYISIPRGTTSIEHYFAFSGESGYAFYTDKKEFIVGGNDEFLAMNIPLNARYAVFTSYEAGKVHKNKAIRMWNYGGKAINCWGDSVTEGMNMVTQTKARYGGDNYPSHLLTMLYDNHHDYFVCNNGNSGEKSNAVLARVGGRGCAYFKEYVYIPANGGSVEITNKLHSTLDDSTVVLTRANYVSNPCYIDGIEYELYTDSTRTHVYIKLKNPSSTEWRIPINTPIIIGSEHIKRNADVNIVFMGINDGNSISCEEWVRRCGLIKEDTNSKTLVIGFTHPMWNNFTDLSGDSSQKQYQYLKKAREAFGIYFCDLFPVMCKQRGIDIALANGYLTDRTPEQIAADNDAISRNLTPPSLTEDGTAGNVHFNNVGYYVMAKVIYERLLETHLID